MKESSGSVPDSLFRYQASFSRMQVPILMQKQELCARERK